MFALLKHGPLATGCLISASFWLTACGSAGPYGYAKTYVPGPGEEQAASGAEEYDPVMVGRRFHQSIGKRVSVFGVVKARNKTTSGPADFVLSIRTLQARNLCETVEESSCRVTVGDHEFGTVHAAVQLKPSENAGPTAIRPGSLLRVIGKVSQKTHPHTGNTVIDADFYRHWPHSHYVTTRAREFMRR